MNEMVNSEEEYSENERKLLEKARQKRQPTNYDSEDEVMGFSDKEYNNDENEEDKDSMASDIEGLEEGFDLPNEKAWGKKKKSYYSTDYVDPDYTSTTQKDVADAEMEEQEARNLQKRLAEQLDEADFGLDLVLTKDNDNAEFEKDSEHIKADLSKLSKRQRQEILEKESPEFLPLVIDFQGNIFIDTSKYQYIKVLRENNIYNMHTYKAKTRLINKFILFSDRLTEAKTVLAPFLDLIEKASCQDCSATNFVRAKYDLLLHYCTNISFYLMLKAKREPVASHPVIKRLAQYRQLLAQLEERQGDLLDQIREILEANSSGQPLYNSEDSTEISFKKKIQKLEESPAKRKNPKTLENKSKKEVAIKEDYSSNDEYDEMEQKVSESGEDQDNRDEDAENEGEKRAITYQIAKNKGLTPHRKKEQRNPRVKHRNKYRKAKIRRRGAVSFSLNVYKVKSICFLI